MKMRGILGSLPARSMERVLVCCLTVALSMSMAETAVSGAPAKGKEMRVVFVRGVEGQVSGGAVLDEVAAPGGGPVTCVRQKGANQRMEWKTAPAPDAGRAEDVIFTWSGGFGGDKSTEGLFLMSVNGRPVADFDVVTEPTVFSTRADGCDLWYDPLRLDAERHVSWGIFYLKLPRSWVAQERVATITVESADSQSDRWCAVVPVADPPLKMPDHNWRLFFPTHLPLPQGWTLNRGPGEPLLSCDRGDGRLPQLSVEIKNARPVLSARFPETGDVFDVWCYESPVQFVAARALPGGSVEMKHRYEYAPGVLLRTVATPEPGGVSLVVRPELNPAGDGIWPEELEALNICLQMWRAPSFAGANEAYPRFSERCFVFTTGGVKFLNQTQRGNLALYAPDHPCNNPPWTQNYVVGSGDLKEMEADPKSWRRFGAPLFNGTQGFSSDRSTVPVIGTVSRDRRWLFAVANDSSELLAQAWLDCLHANPRWTPMDAAVSKRALRLKVYFMRNDPTALLKRVQKDFPSLKPSAGGGGPTLTAPPGSGR